MTAYLQPGDVITLAVPNFYPGNTVGDDKAYWQSVYEPLGVAVHHVAVHDGLTHPVVVAVLRGGTAHVIDDDSALG